MTGRYLVLAGLYFGPFIVALLAPGWRSFLALSALVVGFAVWVFYINETPAGIAGTVKQVLIYIILFGAAAGLVGKGTLLGLGARGLSNRLVSSLVVLTAGAAPPLAVLFMPR